MSEGITVIDQNPLAHLDERLKQDPVRAINYFHRLSREAANLSTQAAAVAGLLLLHLRQTGGNFSDHIKEFEFSRSTAYNYIHVAQSIWGTAVNDRAIEFSEMDDGEKTKFLKEDVQLVDAKALRQLYTSIGVMKPSAMGGKREGAGRKSKEISFEDRVNLANSELACICGNIQEFRKSHKLAFIENPDVIAQSVAVLEEFAEELKDRRE